MSFDRQPLEKVLSSILSPLNLDFAIEKKVIVIKSKPVRSAITDTTKPKTPPGEIRGRVMNENGEPLAGANVVVKRTGKGTTTNANGEFTLKNVDEDDVIVISFVGYETQKVNVNGNNDLRSIIIKKAVNELDETIIKGYYTTTRRLNTGSVSKVTSEEISKQPVMNVLAALEGRMSGVYVQQTSGYASAPIKVEIRGRNTINPIFPSDPVYIIDGVPFKNIYIKKI